jgi:DNA-binding response OmpR family regulator
MSTSPTEQPVSHRVLLVDDDDAVRNMMNATLEHKDFEVVAAANVKDALAEAYRNREL